MKILIVSDTHRQNKNLELVLKKTGPVDMLIHLGDIEGSEDYIEAIAGCPVHMVAGNNDFFTDLEREKELNLGKYRVFMAHGHNYYVSMGTERIKQEAVERCADIVMFGHTHRPLIDMDGSITAINPGSLSYPRQDGRRGSFIIMEIDNKGVAHFTLNFV